MTNPVVSFVVPAKDEEAYLSATLESIHMFPRLARPVLPGFNCLVRRNAYFEAGGFPDVPNEDTAFSRELGRTAETGYHPDVLAMTSGRRIAESGLTGTLYHCLRLDWGRLRADC